MGILDAPGIPRSRVPIAPAPLAPKLGVYDRATCLYNGKPHQFRRTHDGIARCRAHTGFLNTHHLGDSTTAGVGALPGISDWPQQFAKALELDGVPLAGSGMVPANRNYAAADAQVTKGAGWAQWVAGSTILANSTTANPLTFVPIATGTKVIVHYSNQSGPFTVNVDGLGAVAVVPTGSPDYGAYTLTGLADTAHTVVITRTSGTVLIEAFEVQTTAEPWGIRTYNAGLASLQISQFAAAPYYTSANATLYPRFLADVVFVMVEINDANGPPVVPAATYAASYQTLIDNLRAQAPDPDIILMASNPCNGVDFSTYTQKLYDLADTNDLPLIDLQDRWGTFATANAQGLMSDNLHPTAAGYADIAAAVIAAASL